MFKRIALFCLLVGMVAIAGSAYAEVQNIRVSGDIEALAVYRDNYDLEDGRNIGNVQNLASFPAEDTDSLLMSIVRLGIDADLTDNVAVSLRLTNLREWDTDTTATTDIDLDLANITLKEMLYSPLTLIIGRQELNYGSGLVVGNGRYLTDSGGITYRDLSPVHGYDAVQAILDYDPLTVSLVFAKMFEDDDAAPSATVGRDDDVDLYGVNASYAFDSYDAEAEAYLFYERDENFNLDLDATDAYSESLFNESKTYTVGLRGSIVPLENLTLNGEIAGQWGKIYGNQDVVSSGSLERDREAVALNAAAEYALVDVKFAPVLGVEYLYLSGEKGNGSGTGDYEAWNPMYRGKIMGSIRDYLENLYATNDAADTSGWTNQHTIKATGSVDLGELVDGLSLDLAYLRYWFDEVPVAGATDEIGDELNVKLAYDYTEDVQFVLDGAWFMPGDYYDTLHTTAAITGTGSTANTTDQTASRTANDTAVSIIGSCKVTF